MLKITPFGQDILSALAQNDMTQSDLARATGLSKQHINLLIFNTAWPSMKTVDKICDVLKVDFMDEIKHIHDAATGGCNSD